MSRIGQCIASKISGWQGLQDGVRGSQLRDLGDDNILDVPSHDSHPTLSTY